MSLVDVYEKPNCVQCTMTKSFLRKSGIAFRSLDAIKNLDMLRERGIAAAPGIIYEPLGIAVGGFNIDALNQIKAHFEGEHPQEGELS